MENEAKKYPKSPGLMRFGYFVQSQTGWELSGYS
jgi:hypothetical protein